MGPSKANESFHNRSIQKKTVFGKTVFEGYRSSSRLNGSPQNSSRSILTVRSNSMKRRNWFSLTIGLTTLILGGSVVFRQQPINDGYHAASVPSIVRTSIESTIAAEIGQNHFAQDFRYTPQDSGCTFSRTSGPGITRWYACDMAYTFVQFESLATAKIVVRIRYPFTRNQAKIDITKITKDTPTSYTRLFFSCERDPKKCAFTLTPEAAQSVASSVRAQNYEYIFTQDINGEFSINAQVIRESQGCSYYDDIVFNPYSATITESSLDRLQSCI